MPSPRARAKVKHAKPSWRPTNGGAGLGGDGPRPASPDAGLLLGVRPVAVRVSFDRDAAGGGGGGSPPPSSGAANAAAAAASSSSRSLSPSPAPRERPTAALLSAASADLSRSFSPPPPPPTDPYPGSSDGGDESGGGPLSYSYSCVGNARSRCFRCRRRRCRCCYRCRCRCCCYCGWCCCCCHCLPNLTSTRQRPARQPNAALDAAPRAHAATTHNMRALARADRPRYSRSEGDTTGGAGSGGSASAGNNASVPHGARRGGATVTLAQRLRGPILTRTPFLITQGRALRVGRYASAEGPPCHCYIT